MKRFGIDISEWQDGFNFSKALAEGVKFVILRGADHFYKDRCFEDFYKQCKDKNIPVGVYHYSRATNAQEAKQEAEFLLNNVLKGKKFEYPIYMDVEADVQKRAGKVALTNAIIAYCETLESAGYYAGIYASGSFLRSYTDESKLASYDKWIAQWYTKCQYTGAYGMWQFGGETNMIRTNKVAGVVCDQDYAYKDYPKIMIDAKLNGYGTVSTHVNKPTNETPKNPVVQSKPTKVAAKDPAKYYNKALSGTYKVTGSALNIRHGAGITKGIMTTIPKGTAVKCYGYYSKSLGVKWLYIQFTYKGVTYSGFASSNYLLKI